jgi:hypothetical protein
MKLIVYHQNAGQLENYCQRLTKGKNTVIIKTTLLKQLHRLLAFCQPKCVFIDPADAPRPADGTLPLEAIVLHRDDRAQKILSDQLQNLGFPIAAVLSSMGDLRHWLAANAPSMVFFEPDNGLVSPPEAMAPSVTHPENPNPSLRESMQKSGFVLMPHSQWLERAAAAEAQIRGNKNTVRFAAKKAREFFEINCLGVPQGLDTLPGCWMEQLPELFIRITAPSSAKLLSLSPSELWQNRGVLHVLFALEKQIPLSDGDTSIWDEVRMFLNLNLLPSRWTTPLKTAA